MQNEAQQISYNAGWNKGRWPNNPAFSYTVSQWSCPVDYFAGMRDGRKARIALGSNDPH